MSQESNGSRPRRFATACDDCNRRKVKCGATEPPCQHCIRRGIDCTFTRAAPDLSKARRAGRQLKVVSERLRHVEGLLAEAQGQENDPIESTVIRSAVEGSRPAAEPTSDDVLAQPVSHETLMIVELFFEHYEYFFPCFDKMKLINSIVQPGSRGPNGTPSLRIAVNAMMSIAFRMARFAGANDDHEAIELKADHHLDSALRQIHHILAAEPTLLCIQALLLTSASMSLSSGTDMKRASVILAAAYRGIQLLEYDALQDQNRAEARTLCTICIMDGSLSMHLNVAPLIRDELSITADLESLRPQHRGTLSTRDGSISIDLFAARLKLALIQSQIWSRLLAPSACTAPREARLTAYDDLRAMLVSWRNANMPPLESLKQELWPDTVYVHVVKLVLEYFLTLRRLLPASFSSVDGLGEHLDLLTDSSVHALKVVRENVLLPTELVSGSQYAHAAVRSIGRAGLPWLRETLPAIIAANVVSYQAAIVESDSAALQHFDRAETWFELLSEVSSKAMPKGNDNAMSILARLRQLASMAVEVAAG